MAPEVVEKKPHNYKVDIWSLGILLYEMIHSFTPFRGNNEMDKKVILENIVNLQPEFKEPINVDLKNLIISLLSKDPKKRPEIKDILSSTWVHKKLYSFPLKVNECIKSKIFHKKQSDILPPSRKLKNLKPVDCVLKKSSTIELSTSKRKSIFEEHSVREFPYNSNEILSVLSKPPLSATKHKSFLFINSTENKIFEDGKQEKNENKKNSFIKNMIESLKTLEDFEKRKKSELSTVSESSFAEVSEEGLANQVNLFPKSNVNKELLLKNN